MPPAPPIPPTAMLCIIPHTLATNTHTEPLRAHIVKLVQYSLISVLISIPRLEYFVCAIKTDLVSDR